MVAHSRGKLLLAWLMCFWRAVLFLAFVSWGSVTGAVIVALEGQVRPDLVRPIANAVGAPIALLVCIGFVWQNVAQLSCSHLCVEGAKVTFRGYVGWRGVVERRYQLNELASVALGQPPNAVERFCGRFNGAVAFALFLKDGLLFVTDVYGENVTFAYVNIAFDPDEVKTFVTVLSGKGVGGASAAEPGSGPTPAI